jgi:hypothetical protein
MNWISKHADTVIVLSGIALSVLWMDSKFYDLKEEIVVMKTILIIKD